MVSLQSRLTSTEPVMDPDHIRGRSGPWTKEQFTILQQSLPALEEFFATRKLDGRDVRLTKWKQDEADRVLQLPAFKELKDGVSFRFMNGL